MNISRKQHKDSVSSVVTDTGSKNDNSQSPENNSELRKGKAVKDKKNKASRKMKKPEVSSSASDEIAIKSDEIAIKTSTSEMSIAAQIEKARAHIKESLLCMENIVNVSSSTGSVEVMNRLEAVEKENANLKNETADLKKFIGTLENRIKKLESGKPGGVGDQKQQQHPQTNKKQAAAKTPTKKDTKPVENDDDDDVDLFGSDSDDADAQKVKDQRVAEYSAKKSKKPALIAKSNIILDVKPWDDETDMKLMEEEVRKITCDGLLWGASKLVPLAYGIHKLQISCVVEDEKVSVDWLEEMITGIEDYVQSVDVAAFNKV